MTGFQMTHIKGQGFVPTNISIDRIDNDRGYDIDNIRLVCYRANVIRSNMSDTELWAWCQAIYSSIGKR